MPRWLKRHPKEIERTEAVKTFERKQYEKSRYNSLLESNSLPKRECRMLLLKFVLETADSLHQHHLTRQRHSAETTRSLVKPLKNANQLVILNNKQKPRHDAHSQRYRRILQQELVPASTDALCLTMPHNDLEDGSLEKDQLLVSIYAEAAGLNVHEINLSHGQALASVTLLLSNILLQQEAKGYDALIRHALKTASVDFLSHSFRTQLQSTGDLYEILDFPKTTIYETTSANQSATHNVSSPCTNGKNDPQTCTPAGSNESSPESVNINAANDEHDFESQTGKEDNKSLSDDESVVDINHERENFEKDLRLILTRKFEALERIIAKNIYLIMLVQETSGKVTDGERGCIEEKRTKQQLDKNQRRKLIVRGLQITSMGVLAGTLFAMTGGLAGPAIAAGIAGLGLTLSSTQAAAIAMLTTVKAAAALFGVGGGGLAAYKMKKRTAGISEFTIRRENIAQNMYEGASEDMLKRGIANSLPQLHTTICISGWIHKNVTEFQSCWGVQPTDPPITDKATLLKRFFLVHDPEQVEHVDKDLKRFGKKFDYERCWVELRQMYGCDPDHVLPFARPTSRELNKDPSLLTPEQKLIHQILASVLFLKQGKDDSNSVLDETTLDDLQFWKADNNELNDSKKDESLSEEKKSEMCDTSQKSERSSDPDTFCLETYQSAITHEAKESLSATNSPKGPDIIQPVASKVTISSTSPSQHDFFKKDNKEIVWDWQSMYGGDLHTITWESKMLTGLGHIASKMASDITSQATKQALQYTAIVGSFFAAVAPASTLASVSNLIDDPYQIAILRAEETGKELAKCLLQSEERRPVTLVGYSFAARVILSCLMELHRHQEKWEKDNDVANADILSDHLSSDNNKDEEYFTITREPASIVEDVVFIGLPRTSSYRVMSICREMTNGRLINCYTKNDWLINIMFVVRGRGQKSIIGTSPVEFDQIQGIENYDVSEFVEAHSKFGYAIPKILRKIGLHEPVNLSTCNSSF